MPRINKQITITPKQFLSACNAGEKRELWRLLQAEQFDTGWDSSDLAKIDKVKTAKTDIQPPFSSEKFASAWQTWKEYKKKEHGFKFKTKISERATLKRLAIDSGHEEWRAIEMIRRSIEKGWSGLFPLPSGYVVKKNNNVRKNFGR